MRKLKFKYIILIILILFVLIYFFVPDRQERLIKEGNKDVKAVELFKKKHHRLPNSFEEAGIKTTEDYELWYAKNADSTEYMIWFGTNLGESETYYSDSKKWEDYGRWPAATPPTNE